jgi:hypothetical protein
MATATTCEEHMKNVILKRTMATTAGLLFAAAVLATAPSAQSGTVSGIAAQPVNPSNASCLNRSHVNQMYNSCSNQVAVVIDHQNNSGGAYASTNVHVWGGGNTSFIECQTYTCNKDLSTCYSSGYTASNDPPRAQDLKLNDVWSQGPGTNSVFTQCLMNPGASIFNLDVWNSNGAANSTYY